MQEFKITKKYVTEVMERFTNMKLFELEAGENKKDNYSEYVIP